MTKKIHRVELNGHTQVQYFGVWQTKGLIWNTNKGTKEGNVNQWKKEHSKQISVGSQSPNKINYFRMLLIKYIYNSLPMLRLVRATLRHLI